MGYNKKNKSSDTEQTANSMPESITELTPIVKEFIGRLRTLENEMTLLRESKTELIAEYAEKLDTKTLKQAIKVVDLKAKVEHKGAFDLFLEILERDEV